jgi:sortase A
MKLLDGRKRLKLFLLWAQRVLFSVAVVMFAYCGFVLIDAWIFQARENRLLEQQLTHRPRPESATLRPESSPSPDPPSPAVTAGLIGRIEIAHLGLSVIVMEGTSRTTLRRAVGHIAGTSLPGRPGNIGIAGHRDTFFRPLRNIRQGDAIVLTTLTGAYRYRVVSATIVPPSDIELLYPSLKEVLTLVTCYPFDFVGSAPNRFVVRALRVT